MLAEQFLVNSLVETHPNHNTIERNTPPRLMKHTLQSRFGENIMGHLPPDFMGTITPGQAKYAIKAVNTTTVDTEIVNTGPNRVLNVRPPDIDASEQRLSRRTRTLLTQIWTQHTSQTVQVQDRVRRLG